MQQLLIYYDHITTIFYYNIKYSLIGSPFYYLSENFIFMKQYDRFYVLIKGGLYVIISTESTFENVITQLKNLGYCEHRIEKQSNLLSFSYPDLFESDDDTLLQFNRERQLSKAVGNITCVTGGTHG